MSEYRKFSGGWTSTRSNESSRQTSPNRRKHLNQSSNGRKLTRNISFRIRQTIIELWQQISRPARAGALLAHPPILNSSKTNSD